MTDMTILTAGDLDPDTPITATTAGAWYYNLFAFAEKATNAPVLANGYVTQAMIASASVGQSQLKETLGQVSTTSATQAYLVLPGGAYGFYPRMYHEQVAGIAYWGAGSDGAARVTGNTPLTTAMLQSSGVGYAAYMTQRYIQACRPYDLGDGEIGQFVFALIDKSGMIVATYAAPEAPWHNNGPTDTSADYYDKDNRGWRSHTKTETTWSWSDEAQMLVPMTHVIGRETIEITQAVKQADMALIPHPFLGNDLTGKTVVLLDPVADLTWHLGEMHEQGESPNSMLHDDYIRIDNTALNRAGPPGVVVVSANWRNTQ